MTLEGTSPIEGKGSIAAVTGANGYLGSMIVVGLAQAGFHIRRLVRRPEPDRDDHLYDVASGCSPGALEGADVLVHCAYDLSVTKRAAVWETNVYGTRSLLDLAVTMGVRRTILVSSMSAYAGTRQIYGRAKLASESDAFARDMCAIRPGLVYGPAWGGMAGTLRKLTALPVVPLIGRHSHQFTLHESDLVHSVTTLAGAAAVPSRPLGLAHPDPVSFEHLLRAVARADSGRVPRFVPVPWRLLYWALRSAELVRLNQPVRADSILGLIRPAPCVPNLDDVKALGVTFRPFSL